MQDTRDETRKQLHDNFESKFDKQMIGSKAGITYTSSTWLPQPLASIALGWPWEDWLTSSWYGRGRTPCVCRKRPIFKFCSNHASVTKHPPGKYHWIPFLGHGGGLRMHVSHYLLVDLTLNHFSRYSTSNYNGQEIWNLGNGQNAWSTMVATIITTTVIWHFQWVSSLCLDRLKVAPEYTLEEWPAAVQVQSKHNTPIEGFWWWKCQGEGHSICEAIFIGKSKGLYNPNNELHQCVFDQGLYLY